MSDQDERFQAVQEARYTAQAITLGLALLRETTEPMTQCRIAMVMTNTIDRAGARAVQEFLDEKPEHLCERAEELLRSNLLRMGGF